MKNVLILGANVYQLPLIRAAKALGRRVIVVSFRENEPGMALADEPWVMDTTDWKGILERARGIHLDAVVSTGTDAAVVAMGHLCDELGFPGVTADAAVVSTSKTAMQERFARHHVPAARFLRVRSLPEAEKAAAEIGYPIVVKAPDSSGSRGVTMVESPAELPAAVACALEHAKAGELLVEQRLSGTEFGAQVIVSKGEVVGCFCHNDTTTPPPVVVPIGHSCPSLLPPEVQAEAAAVCAAAVRALGIANAVCNADLIHTPDGVRFFELAARTGATGLPEVVGLHFLVDLYQVALQLAFGEAPNIAVKEGPASAILLIRAPRTGRLVRQHIPPHVLDWPGVQRISFDYPAGTPVRTFRVGPDRIGDVVVTADTPQNAERLAERVVESLEIDVAES